MKKFGFTLAEVLITLGIVGVVAALTAPGLVMNSRNEANAAKLSVVVSNIENAFTSAIVSEGVKDLYGTRMWSRGGINGASTLADRRFFAGELGRYLNITGTSNVAANPTSDYYRGANLHPMNTTGQTNANISLQDFPTPATYFPIFLKNGAVMHINTWVRPNLPQDPDVGSEQWIRELGGSMIYNPADIMIDVNGINGPNTFGRDIFAFNVNEKGILFPCGSLDSSLSDFHNDTTQWNQEGNIYNCTAAGNFGSNERLRGFGCSARLVQEGYKMNY